MKRYLGDDWTLPALDDHNRAFFTSGRLMIQTCAACGAQQHPPEEVCGSCQSTDLRFDEVEGKGRVESVVVVQHAVHPGLKERVPYAVAVVSLDAAPGVHVIGNVIDTEPGEVRIGQKVKAVFESVPADGDEEALLIPQWELA